MNWTFQDNVQPIDAKRVQRRRVLDTLAAWSGVLALAALIGLALLFVGRK